jgi:hypothetical protein
MTSNCIRSIDTQLISEQDTFLRLSREDLKAETENEIAAHDQALQKNIMQQKFLTINRTP